MLKYLVFCKSFERIKPSSARGPSNFSFHDVHCLAAFNSYKCAFDYVKTAYKSTSDPFYTNTKPVFAFGKYHFNVLYIVRLDTPYPVDEDKYDLSNYSDLCKLIMAEGFGLESVRVMTAYCKTWEDPIADYT